MKDQSILVKKAAQLAVKWHAGQKRKYSDVPYDCHLARTAGRVLVMDESTPIMVAGAWLHDGPEDTKLTLRDISSLISPEVALLVEQLTNAKHPTYLSREERKALDRERLVKVSYEAKLIKCCDRLDNLYDIPASEGAFRLMYARESVQLIDALMYSDNRLTRHPAAMALFTYATELARS